MYFVRLTHLTLSIVFFCRIYAISVKLSPEKRSSGIQCLEANNFKIYCFQTLTGQCPLCSNPLPLSLLTLLLIGKKIIP